jgi:hypothetical protein
MPVSPPSNQPPPNPVDIAKMQAEMADARSKAIVAQANERKAMIEVEIKEVELASKKLGAASDMHKDVHGPHGADLPVVKELIQRVESLQDLVLQVIQGQPGNPSALPQ